MSTRTWRKSKIKKVKAESKEEAGKKAMKGESEYWGIDYVGKAYISPTDWRY